MDDSLRTACLPLRIGCAAGTDTWTTASSDDLAQFQAAEAQKWGRVIKAAAGIEPE